MSELPTPEEWQTVAEGLATELAGFYQRNTGFLEVARVNETKRLHRLLEEGVKLEKKQQESYEKNKGTLLDAIQTIANKRLGNEPIPDDLLTKATKIFLSRPNLKKLPFQKKFEL